MKAFPNPLTPAEEKKYIQRYTEGDLEAKHILIERIFVSLPMLYGNTKIPVKIRKI